MRVRSILVHRSRLAGLVRLTTATLLLTANSVALPARAETADAQRGSSAVQSINAVTNWNRIAVTTLVAFPPPAGGAPPALQVNMAMVQGAVYDAINAIEPRHRPYLLETPFRRDCFEGGRRGDRGIPRPLEHRLDGAVEHSVPEPGGLVAGA